MTFLCKKACGAIIPSKKQRGKTLLEKKYEKTAETTDKSIDDRADDGLDNTSLSLFSATYFKKSRPVYGDVNNWRCFK